MNKLFGSKKPRLLDSNLDISPVLEMPNPYRIVNQLTKGTGSKQ